MTKKSKNSKNSNAQEKTTIKLDTAEKFMKNLQKENPHANWRNLITGFVVVFMFGVFSFWYFNSSKYSFEEVDDLTQPTQQNISEQLPDVEGITATPNVVEVQKGEGLWHVAKRVCNDGYKSDEIAKQNGLQTTQALFVGQKLTVDCEE